MIIHINIEINNINIIILPPLLGVGGVSLNVLKT